MEAILLGKSKKAPPSPSTNPASQKYPPENGQMIFFFSPYFFILVTSKRLSVHVAIRLELACCPFDPWVSWLTGITNDSHTYWREDDKLLSVATDRSRDEELQRVELMKWIIPWCHQPLNRSQEWLHW